MAKEWVEHSTAGGASAGVRHARGGRYHSSRAAGNSVVPNIAARPNMPVMPSATIQRLSVKTMS